MIFELWFCKNDRVADSGAHVGQFQLTADVALIRCSLALTLTHT
jgi:hypothetical protein